MVKSTVRFPQEVLDKIEQMVEEGTCSNKSEFQRFAVEYALSKATDHDPDIVDFAKIRTEIFTEQTKGDIPTAEEYIDTHYPASDPRSILLDDILAPYRNQLPDE